MTSYQAHSSIAIPDTMLVSTYLINHGALQVNARGERFGDETLTYERHAAAVQAQPDRTVVEIFDALILQETLANYPRFADCQAAGIVQRADSLAELASIFELDPDILGTTLAAYEAACRRGHDAFGRTRFGEPLRAPFYGITVTSALVQTLGGLRIDARGQVLRTDGSPIPGLYAGGGTAAGFAGDRPEGYLAGMGLLAAFGLGWIAAKSIARDIALSS
jgi:fumarate reductase flavoprotein subunit